LRTDLRRELVRRDLVERDNGHPLPELSVRKEVLAHLLVFDDDVKELSSGGDLQCSGFVVVLLIERDE